MLFHVTDAQVKSTKPNLHPPTTCKLLSLLSKHQWHQFSFSNRFLLYEAKCRGTDTWELQFFPSFSVTSRGRGSALLQWIGPLRKMINYKGTTKYYQGCTGFTGLRVSESQRISVCCMEIYGTLRWMSCILRLHPGHLGISWRSDVDGTAVGGHFSLARTQRHNDLAKPEGAPPAVNLAMHCMCWM